MSSRKQGAGVRSPGGCRARPSRRVSVVSAAFLLLAATPVWAAHVVDVRVGHHATFTRVVFELDSPTGYRVERHAPVPGVSELVITLDASSETESLVTRDQSLIEGIEQLPSAPSADVLPSTAHQLARQLEAKRLRRHRKR